jgi:hypothetical protein
MGYLINSHELNRDARDYAIGQTREFTGRDILSILFSVWGACSDRSHEMVDKELSSNRCMKPISPP